MWWPGAPWGCTVSHTESLLLPEVSCTARWTLCSGWASLCSGCCRLLHPVSLAPSSLSPWPMLPNSDEDSETLPHVLLSPPRISLSVDLTGHWDSEQNTQKCNSLTVPALLFIHFHSLPKVICFLRVLKGNRVFSRLLSSGVILGKLPSLYLRCLI